MKKTLKTILSLVLLAIATAVSAQTERVIFFDDFSGDEVGKAPKNWTGSVIEDDSIDRGEIKYATKILSQPGLKVVMKNGVKALSFYYGSSITKSYIYAFGKFDHVETSESHRDGAPIFPAVNGEKLELPDHFMISMEIFIPNYTKKGLLPINYDISFGGHSFVMFAGNGASREGHFAGGINFDGGGHNKIPVKPNDWNRLIFTYNKGAVTTTINGNPLVSPDEDVYTKHSQYFAINGDEADLLFIKSLKIVEL